MKEERAPSLRDSLETSLEIIAEDPVLRVLLKRIPLVGDSLTELAAGKGQQIIEARRDEFLQLLAEHLAALEEQAVRKDYFQTPEGFDLLTKALDESRRTRSKEKRDLYARILKGAIVDFEQKEYSAEEYLHLVADLTPKELDIARVLYEIQDGQEYKEWDWDIWSPQREEVSERCSVDESELSLFLNRIASTGLIDKVNLMYPGASRDSYKISPSFEKLMEFLKLGS